MMLMTLAMIVPFATLLIVGPALAGFRGFAAAHLRIAFGHGRSAGEFDTSFFIDTQALDPDLVAELDDVLGLFDAEVSQLADVH
jgi:hypothetical protein